MNIIDKLKPGDLIAVSCGNFNYIGLFHKFTGVSVQYFAIKSWVLRDFKEKGVSKATKWYINNWGNHYRVVKITEDTLVEDDLPTYKEMKAIYEGIYV